MFGITYVKAQPNTYFMQFKKGAIAKEGAGLSFFFYAPMSSLVAIPMASVDIPFIFKEVAADFQEVTVQGQVAYRVIDPRKLSKLLNFTLATNNQTYASDDPDKLPQRIINQVQVLMRAELQKLTLRETLKQSTPIVNAVRKGLSSCELIDQLGIEILSLSVLAIKPNPETARALEAEIREQLLLEADEAIYTRRNAAVEQERVIKENELNTEIAVENKSAKSGKQSSMQTAPFRRNVKQCSKKACKGILPLKIEREIWLGLPLRIKILSLMPRHTAST